MKQVTLKFSSLAIMAECINQLGLVRPSINYNHFLFTAELSEEQIQHAVFACKAQLVDTTIVPDR
jgi:hypothetical protein